MIAPYGYENGDRPSTTMPYGIGQLDLNVVSTKDCPKRVRCFVRGCDRFLVVGRGSTGDVCPRHGIRCFHSSSGSTYAYHDMRRNIIASPDTLRKRVIGHPFKYESHRLGLERSEDALSWNVFRSLQEAKVLHRLAALITGDAIKVEPFLYLWGLCLTNDDFDPWNLLIAARKQFESDLPVVRPFTEPDVALYLPGRYLVLIEAKFTSSNTFYQAGPRKDASSLTLDELRTIYSDDSLRILDRKKASVATRIYQQLWRNTVFAEWMAAVDHPRTGAWHVNLVRRGYDQQSAAEFQQLVTPPYRDHFQQITWEQIYELYADEESLGQMKRYLENKTAGLKPAFRLP